MSIILHCIISSIVIGVVVYFVIRGKDNGRND